MDSKNIKFLVPENRVGMAQEILSALALRNLNIETMEIKPPYISVKVKWDGTSWDEFKIWIKGKIKEILDVSELDMMESEKVAKELQIVINTMGDGIIAVNKIGEIEYYNSKASHLFGITSEDKSSNINLLLPEEYYNPKFDVDKSNVEISSKIRGKKVNLLLNVRVIKNSFGKKMGALLIFKEMEEVRKLIQTIARPSMITFDDIVGESDKIKNTILLAKSVSKTDANIMILGESGTGKELFARAIHLNSNRGNGPFVAVNCSAVPEALLESEFFGYEKGAFTGASNTGKQGLFELATGGSIFLDEIAEIPVHLQAKILRVIQEKTLRRIGGGKEVPVDVRIISATHRNLLEMVRENTFREDLYYRLNVIPVQLPPLRERKEDISVLAKHFIRVLGKNLGKADIDITQNALDELKKYHWPGNIRELQNVIERALIFSQDLIDIEHLMIINLSHAHNIKTKGDNDNIDFPVNLPQMVRELEIRHITKAMEVYSSSREIAKALGISHTKVISRLKEFDCK